MFGSGKSVFRTAIAAVALLAICAASASARPRDRRQGRHGSEGGYYGGNYGWGGNGWGGYGPGYGYGNDLAGGPMGPYGDMGRRSFYYSPGNPDAVATININVPVDARVWFDDYLTRQSGEQRVFETPPLLPNRTFTYTLRVRWMDKGKPMEETRTVEVRAGQRAQVDFTK